MNSDSSRKVLSDSRVYSSTCTYTTTKRVYQVQNFLRCVTCDLNDLRSSGICQVCKAVCHRGHVVQKCYGKESILYNCFCDCGEGQSGAFNDVPIVKLKRCRCFLSDAERDDRVRLIIDFLENRFREQSQKNNLKKVKLWDSDENHFLIPEYLFSNSSSNITENDENIITMPAKIPIIGDLVFYKIIFFVPLRVEEMRESAINLSLFLIRLGLKNQLLFLCSCVKYLPLKSLLELFVLCVHQFENKEELSKTQVDSILSQYLSQQGNEISSSHSKQVLHFQSPLSEAIFLEVKERLPIIEKDDKYIDCANLLRRIEYFEKVKYFSTEGVEEHPEFSDDIFVSHMAEERILSNLIVTQKQTNIELVSGHCDSIVFKAHKEILILKSTFFFRMFKFPGIESASSRVVLDDLSPESIRYLLFVIYDESRCEEYMKGGEKTRKSLQLRHLFELLVHSEMYDEMILRRDVLEQIQEEMKFAYENDEMNLRILEMGKYLVRLPEKILEDFVVDWGKFIAKSESKLQQTAKHQYIRRECDEENYRDNIKNQIRNLMNLKKAIKKSIKGYIASQEEEEILGKGILEKRKRDDDENDDTQNKPKRSRLNQ